jgi:DNA (cytosine-5)-methyltransferase 1
MHDQQAVITYGLDRASFNQGKNAKFSFSIDEEKIGAQTAKGPGAVFQSVVRRLTPLECERLQGYPDGWTNIGEWVDSKGKKHKDADSPRYKALGNSIALPFWEWMAERMVKYIDHKPTMASLFDGIGGFPLVFSRCGCIPIWASEIEEFPMAVTKLRFPSEEEKG